MRIAEAVFWNSMMMTVAPSSPSPTVNIPATPPVRNATLSAAGSEPDFAAGRGADVAAHREAHADETGEARQRAPGEERERAEDARLREGEPGRAAHGDCGLQHFGRSDEHDDRERYQDHGDRLELPPEVRHRTFLDGGGDLDHLGRALVERQHAADEVEPDRDREQRSACREHEPEPLTAL